MIHGTDVTIPSRMPVDFVGLRVRLLGAIGLQLQEIVRAMRMHPEAGGPANGRTVSVSALLCILAS
jgi:hypothetical protein